MYWIKRSSNEIRFSTSEYCYRLLVYSSGYSDVYDQHEEGYVKDCIEFEDYKSFIKALVLSRVPYKYITEVERV
jgi:hypothetical protein